MIITICNCIADRGGDVVREGRVLRQGGVCLHKDEELDQSRRFAPESQLAQDLRPIRQSEGGRRQISGQANFVVVSYLDFVDVVGDGNFVVVGDGNFVVVNANFVVVGDSNIIVGDSNIIVGDGNFVVVGDGNFVVDFYSFIRRRGARPS